MRAIVGACAVAVALSASGCGESVSGPGDVTAVNWRLQSLQRADRSIASPPPGTFSLRFAR